MKKKYKEYSTGGDILQATMKGASSGMMLGPWGAAAGGAIGLLGSSFGAIQQNRADKTAALQSNQGVNNPYGNVQLRFGGDLNQIKSIVGPSHENGGVPIDMNGNPNSANPIGEAEGKETSVSKYIFSDFLKDLDGISFSKKSKKLQSKIKGVDRISMNSKALRLKELSIKQDALRKENTTNYRLGGPITNESSKEDIKAFQEWAVAQDWYDGQLGNFGDNGVDGVYGKNTMNVFDQYGTDYKNYQANQITSDFFKNFELPPINETPELRKVKEMNFNNIDVPNLDAPMLNVPNAQSTIANVNIGEASSAGANLSGLGYLGKGLEFATLFGQAIQKPEPMSKYLGANRNSRLRLANSMKIDPQAMLNENTRSSTAMRNTINSASLTQSQRLGNLQQSYVNQANANSNVLSKVDAQNNQYKGARLNTMARLDAEHLQARDIYDRNVGAKQAAVQNVGKSIGNLGGHLLERDVVNKQNEHTSGLLNQMFSNFEYDQATGKLKFKNGN